MQHLLKNKCTTAFAGEIVRPFYVHQLNFHTFQENTSAITLIKPPIFKDCSKYLCGSLFSTTW